jgi:DNA replication and repair protein RecF
VGLVVLAHLALTDFRNFVTSAIVLTPGLTIIEGKNGEGKSNLLEAAFMFAALHPLRTRSTRDLVRFGAGGFRLQGSVDGEARPFAVSGDGERRRLFAGEVLISAGGWVPRGLRPVAFLPEDVALAAEGGEARRRYLDEVAGARNPGHIVGLREARRILAQRGRALASWSGAEAWEEPLARAYAGVAAGRRGAATALSGLLPALAEEFGESGMTTVVYRPTVPALAESLGAAQAAAAVASALAAARERESRAGVCLVGPHRDEVQLLVAGEDARRFASRGTQRTLALALRAAQAEIAGREAGSDPLLLVDDVLPELDEGRQRSVLGRAQRATQALLTAAEASRALGGVDAARRYRLEGGKLFPAG